MGKAAEALNDVAVDFGRLDAAGIAGGREQGEREVLIGEILAMLERGVIEKLAFGVDRPVLAQRDRCPRDETGAGVAGEGRWTAAEQVAGELVEDD